MCNLPKTIRHKAGWGRVNGPAEITLQGQNGLPSNQDQNKDSAADFHRDKGLKNLSTVQTFSLGKFWEVKV